MIELTEYEVSFIAKEFLLYKGFNIITFNPPGAQGSFTIPNPQKDSSYTGQTGSITPDIIAIKNEGDESLIKIIESKPKFNQDDIDKMINLINDRERMEILNNLLNSVCKVNKFQIFKKRKFSIIKAHGGLENRMRNVRTIYIKKLNNFDVNDFDANTDIHSNYSVKLC
tara:strand:- start:565 stop:1071 length:507 start_codon:yes stop_codon:yes gene_type:complete